ncbi:putative coatomer protein complex, gamma sub-unit [Cardiosporidium cionae]|uniref:Coatomer protein complex, gamma sub-unit n=1 Tax=Cardiosporidium cionae TaxID=476202 RepID=A0ABQ7J5Q9_9APIC|nr:putative coatomer protein complex, gamma sub-unit [Cardiosporidium cionae]|eukprot:KAF8819334.1 putative coatomer protein complex, gamma sub-unit [Cardiosporidium cionae]
MISQFFLLSPRGDTIINRDFRGDAIKGLPEVFFHKVKFWSGDAPPLFNVNGITYVFIRRNTLFFVLTTLYNISPTFALELLQRLISIVRDFCGILSEENIRRNFILVYEIIDEIFDFGYPQSTNTELLKHSIYNEPTVVESLPENKTFSIGQQLQDASLSGFSSSLPKTLPSSASQRPVGISSNNTDYSARQNEIFVDIFEKLSVVFNSSGCILNSTIDGSIQAKSYINENPMLKLALNEDMVIRSNNFDQGNGYAVAVLDDCNFHPCVDLRDFDKYRILSFVPPEGEFTLMDYRVTGDVKLPFSISPILEKISPNKLELIIKIRAEIPEVNCGSAVKVSFHLPKQTSFVVCETFPTGPGQNADHLTSEESVLWTMKRIQGGTEHTLRCRITLSSPISSLTFKEIVNINMQFEIPMYNISNLQVRCLKVADPTRMINPFRWVRYITQSSSYMYRFS